MIILIDFYNWYAYFKFFMVRGLNCILGSICFITNNFTYSLGQKWPPLLSIVRKLTKDKKLHYTWNVLVQSSQVYLRNILYSLKHNGAGKHRGWSIFCTRVYMFYEYWSWSFVCCPYYYFFFYSLDSSNQPQNLSIT